MNIPDLKLLPTIGIWVLAIVLLILIERISVAPFLWDRYLLSLAHGLRGVRLDRFFAIVTWAGSLFLLVPLTVLLCGYLLRDGRVAEACLLGLSLFGIAVLSRLAKLWFARPRPDLYPVIGEIPVDASYPSAHTAQIVTFSMAVWWLLKQGKLELTDYVLTAFVLLLVSLVALSRVYLQVHYPSDVIGGALLGLLWILGLFNLLQNIGLLIR
jgi:membrane-associated phospholipid phosphatase